MVIPIMGSMKKTTHGAFFCRPLPASRAVLAIPASPARDGENFVSWPLVVILNSSVCIYSSDM